MAFYCTLLNRVLMPRLFTFVDNSYYSEGKQFKIKQSNKMSKHILEEKINLVKTIFTKSVNAVKPKGLIVENNFFELVTNSNGCQILRVNDIGSVTYDIDLTNKKIHLIGFGKAVYGLAVQIERILGNRLTSGLLSIPVGAIDQFKDDPDYKYKNTIIKFIEGGLFNRPDENSLIAGSEVKKLTESMTENDVIISLTSGGASALIVYPKEGVTLNEKSNLIQKLSNLGGNITEMNVVRIALSEIKGGKLCESAAKAHKFISLVLSDIIDNPIHLIGSGPCVPINPSNQTPISILKKYNLWDTLDKNIAEVISAAKEHEVKAHYNPNLHLHLIGSNKMVIDSAMEEARKSNYYPVFLSCSIDGDIADVSLCYWRLAVAINEFISKPENEDIFINNISSLGAEIQAQDKLAYDIIKAVGSGAKGIILVGGGECTVHVKGKGLGGRNQEMALLFSHHCANREGDTKNVLLLCSGTDGIDGPTEAAGAIGCSEIINEYNETKEESSPSVEHFLSCNDSFTFYRSLKDGLFQINIGHTGTNVMDLNLLVFKLKEE